MKYVKIYNEDMRHSGVMDISAALDKKADIEYVNELIQAATATFRGTYNVVTDLSLAYNATHSQIEDALETKMAALSIVPDNNDYSFVQIPTSDETQTKIAKVEKYTYNGSEWAYEYELNNSGFTDAQWSAINSGATLELIGKLSALPTNAELTTLLNAKVSYDDNGAYDVSAHNSGATFASLSALLSNENIDTLIPAAVRKGGMSIRFVQTYDNKYVHYRYMEIAITGSPNPFLNTNNWQGVDTTPTAGSKNLITSDAVYNESKKSDVILAVDKTDLSKGYYYDNTTGEKVANQNCLSKLMDIPTNTKEINVIGSIDTTVAFFGIAIYDAPIAELTDENISDHFIKGFTCRDLLEVSRVVVNNSYKSIAVTIGNTFSLQVLFNALESCVHYGSRLLDVFYLNDNYVRNMVGKSVYLRTLDKTTGIVSLRDPVTGTDYNMTSTIKKGKELLLSKDANYVYLGVLVDWDIIDYNFSNISQTADNTFVLSTPKSAEGQKFFDMIYNKKYRQTGNTTVNGDGVVSEFDCVWEDGTTGHVAYNTFDDDVLEYRSSIVTYGVSYAVYYGLKTFDEYGNITSETGLEIRVIN